MPIKLDGEVFDLNAPTARILAVKQFLDKAPKDEIFSTDGLAKKGFSDRAIRAFAHAGKFQPYFHTVQRSKFIFGHPKAIVAFKALLAKKFADGGE